MKVLVLGAQGMLGAVLMRQLADQFDVYGTALSKDHGSARLIQGVDVANSDDVERVMESVNPDAVVNCAGIVKSECSIQSPERILAVNTRAPHAIAAASRRRGCRFVHVSTDCVFSGKRGSYHEYDPVDAEDLYGRSKAAGEIVGRPDCLTIRTSFIGRDPRRQRGLLEWLLAQQGAVPGFTRARWSGLSTFELARAISLALATPHLFGLYHVAGPPISKADLLEVLVRELGLGCRVDRVDEQPIDRTLNGSRFADATGYVPSTWVEMAQELA